MKRFLPKSKLKHTLLLSVIFMFLGMYAYSQSSLYPDVNCVSGDLTFDRYYLGDIDGIEATSPCDYGVDTLDTYIWLQTTNSNTRYDIFITYTVIMTDPISGSSTSKTFNECIWIDNTGNVSGNKINISPVPFKWACGNILEITEFGIAWKGNENKECDFTSPKCQYIPDEIVNAPLVASFDWIPDCSAGGAVSRIKAWSTTTGGDKNYTFSWTATGSLSTTLSTNNDTIWITYPESALTNPPTIELDVTDGESYTDNYSTTVYLETCCTLDSAYVTITDSIDCFGGVAEVTLTNVGGNDPITYILNGIEDLNGDGIFEGIQAGIYNWSVSEAGDGCAPITGSLTLTDPDELTVDITNSADPKCFEGNDGTATASANGGTGTLDYSWNTIPAQTTATATGLEAGQYIVTVTDDNGCSAKDTVTLTDPDELTVDITNSADPKCFEGNDGTATASANGGTGTLDYSWNTIPAQTTATATGLEAGQYIVTVTDDNGCSAKDTVTLTDPDELTVDITNSADPKCFEGNDGTATASANGGTGTLDYSWNTIPAQTTATATGLEAGQYIVTVTDDNGCSAKDTITLTDPDELTVDITNSADPKCFEGNDGTATASANGGTGTLDYSWNTIPAQTTATATGLEAGQYIVTVTDDNGCSAKDTITLTDPDELTVDITNSADPKCFEGNDGTATASANGGTGTLDYSWNTIPAQTTATATGLEAGQYIVTVTDDNGCSAKDTVTLTDPDELTVDITNSADPKCFEGNDGTATASANGGTGTLDYSWNTIPAQTTATATGLEAGQYIVTVTDDNGCSAKDTITLTDPDELTVDITNSADPKCFEGNDGTATASANGGTGTLDYSWNTIPAQTTATATGLEAGQYIVTVTDDNGCSAKDTVTLTDPDELTVDITNSADPKCFEGNDGTATASANGGTGTLDYSWNTIPAQTTATATGLEAGQYIVTVTDDNGCSAKDTVTLTDPDELTVDITNSADPKCFEGNDGTATASANGGTGTLDYSWNTIPAQTTATATGLEAGQYIVTVTDDNGCSAKDTVTLTDPDELTVDITNSADPKCFEGNDGTATASANGGTGTLDYSWNTIPAQTTATATGLEAGQYIVTVTDDNGCSAKDTVTLTDPDELTVDITNSADPKCFEGNDGTATASANGGTGTLDYSWNTIPAQTTATATGLEAGQYIVTVTDDNGCSAKDTVTLTDPDELTVDITNSADPKCFEGNDGTATASANGGTGTLDYSWNTIPAQTTATATGLEAGQYIVTVTDDNGCSAKDTVTLTDPDELTVDITNSADPKCFEGNDGTATASANGGTGTLDYSWNTIPAQTTATATGLEAGQYIVTVTDDNGCSAKDTITLTDPDELTVDITNSADPKCFEGNDGTATASANGGTGTLDYSWNTIPAQTTATATGLEAGQYIVTVTDDNGCSAKDTVTLTDPDELTVDITNSADPKCFEGNDGTATASANGGTGTLDYSWNTIPAQTTATATGLEAGQYIVTVTDDNGCSAKDTITLTDPDELTVDITNSADPKCFEGNDGTATASANGGTGTLDYSWNTIPAQTTATATGLEAGQYIVTVTDDNGCSAKDTVTLTDPDELTVDITNSADPKCFEGNDGTATASAKGGTGTLDYSWNTIPAQTTATATGLEAGQYIVTVTDDNGCSAKDTVTLTDPDELTVDITNSADPKCFEGNDGTATASANGGTGTLDYSWNTIPAQTTATATGLEAGQYIVTVTDDNGCSAKDTVTLTDPDEITTSTSEISPADCGIPNSGTATVEVSNELGEYSYLWDNGDERATADTLSAGKHYVTITDENLCSVLDSVIITEIDTTAPILTIAADTTINCDAELQVAQASVEDNCDTEAIVSYEGEVKTDGNCENNYILTRTWKAIDDSGNSSTKSQEITVQDTTLPSITCPEDLIIECDASQRDTISKWLASVVANDNCTLDTIINDFDIETELEVSCGESEGTTVTFTAYDACGNTATCTATIKVVDNTAPEIECDTIFVYLYENGEYVLNSGDINNIAAGISDNCTNQEDLEITVSPRAFECIHVGDDVTVRVTATDLCGNSASCNSVVIVRDTVAPVALCKDLTIYLDEDGNASINPNMVNNSGERESIPGWARTYNNLEGGSYDACGISFLLLDKTRFDCGDIGNNIVSLIVGDPSGNQSTCEATITVVDNFNVSAEDVECDVNGAGYYVSFTATGSEPFDVSGTGTPGIWNENIWTSDLIETGVDYSITVMDAKNCGEEIISGTAPDCECPVTSVVSGGGIACVGETVAVNFELTGTAPWTIEYTNGIDTFTVENILESPYTVNVSTSGTYTVISVSDIYCDGGTKTGRAIVTIEDTEDPVVSCNDMIIYLDEDGTQTISVIDVDNESSDICGIDTMFIDRYTFSCSDVGENEITLTVIDLGRNQVTCTSTVTVVDTIAPVANCQEITVELDEAGLVEITTEDINDLSTDNCSIDTMWISPVSFTCDNLGENTVTLTVMDASGNTSTCSTIVTVLQGNALCFGTPPVAVNDTFILIIGCDATSISGNVVLNDFDGQSDELIAALLTQPSTGQLDFSDDGSFVFTNENGFVGMETFTYRVCQVNNNEFCDEAEVVIYVKLDTDCDGIPNEDDIDDDDDGILDIDETFTADSDNDGIPNYLDIDSDNDGILDNIEAQGEGNAYHPPVWVDTDGDGWDDAYDPDNGGTYFGLEDTDGDGTPDFIDLDSDDDGIADEIEGFDVSGGINGGPDSIPDTYPAGGDNDTDGLDDNFDNVDGWIIYNNPTGGNAPLPDYDNNGIRAWRDSNEKPIPGDEDPLTPACELLIPNGFSPNGDNINDYFQIYCFEDYPNAQIEIYNRWGNKVYEKDDYGNTDRWDIADAWWDGRSTHKWTVGNEILPAGTYFYILILNNGSDPITGSIFLNR